MVQVCWHFSYFLNYISLCVRAWKLDKGRNVICAAGPLRTIATCSDAYTLKLLATIYHVAIFCFVFATAAYRE